MITMNFTRGDSWGVGGGRDVLLSGKVIGCWYYVYSTDSQPGDLTAYILNQLA
jgi:hypothetical protein